MFVPALLTRMSRRPKRSRVVLTSPATAASSVTATLTASAGAPSPSITQRCPRLSGARLGRVSLWHDGCTGTRAKHSDSDRRRRVPQMIADVRLFRHGASVGSRVAPHLWCFVLAGATPRLGPATLKRALERATRLAPAHRVVAVVSRDSAPYCAGLLAETPDVATIVQPVYRGSAAELFLPAP